MTKTMPKPKRVSSGACVMCGVRGISKRSIGKHLEKCLKRDAKKNAENSFHLLVTFPYDPRYWLHLEASESVGLRTLDDFLRDIWLECCGHLSHFIIGDKRYVAPEEGVMKEYGDSPMRAKLKEILRKGMSFGHEYDFGSTTELALEVLGYGEPKTSGQAVWLLARNEPIEFPCVKCGHPATMLCVECQGDVMGPEDEGDIFYCDLCSEDANKHPHDNDMLLPVVNSPRMGVCGYGALE